MKSIEVKGTARTIAERSSEQASLYLLKVSATWYTLPTSTLLT